MIKLNLYGNIFGSSGYSVHSRKLMNSLYEEGVTEISYQGPKPQDWVRQVNDAEYNILRKEHFIDGISLCIGTPPCWPLVLGEGCDKFVGFLVWEGSHIPSYFLDYMADKRVDQIWVPSEHVRKAVENTVIRETRKYGGKVLDKICVVPHGADASMFESRKKPEKFTVLVNKGWNQGINDRGGVQFAIKAFLEAFDGRDDVEMICKINPAYITPGWDFAKEIEKLDVKRESDLPVIRVATEFFADDQLVKFYNDGHVLLSPAMAEAFNIPGIEAMMCGLPTIQTAFGGQEDYVKHDENGWLIKPGEMVKPKDVMYEESEWAVPDMEVLKECLGYACDLFYSNPSEWLKLSEDAAKSASDFTWRKSAVKAKGFLNDLINS